MHSWQILPRITVDMQAQSAAAAVAMDFAASYQQSTRLARQHMRHVINCYATSSPAAHFSCGSMTHKSADCLERPRAKGAKWTDKHIAADDKIQEINLVAWDSKRDRYNGYDVSDYAHVVDKYEQVEALRQELKAKEQVEELYRQGKAAEAAAAVAAAAAAAGEDGAAAAAADDAKIADDEDAGG